jgi:DNA-binding MarR family transcriptional regulator
MSSTPSEERAANARAALFVDAAAARLGLNPTDLRCLDLVIGEETITPSRLAALSGLTSGAITGVLDRLEAAGLVRRDSDPADRRRFVVRLLPDRQAEVDELYAGLVHGIDGLLAGLGEPERAAVEAYRVAHRDLLERETLLLRAGSREDGEVVPPAASAPAEPAGVWLQSAPRRGIVRATLIFESGAARLTFHTTAIPGQETRLVAEAGNSRLNLTADAGADDLFSAAFTGPRPDLRVAGATITVRYRFRGFLQRRSAEISLNPEVRWTIVVRGGLSDLDGDLRGLMLDGLDLKGGATRLKLALPEPKGSVRLLFKGNTSAAELRHPASAALSLDVAGTVERLRFGSGRAVSARGKTHHETDGYAGSVDRYQAVFKGNASQLVVRPD